MIRLDFGPSYTYQTDSVNEIIACTFPILLQIGTLAFVIAVLVGVMVGVIAEVNKNKLWDYFPMILAMVGICSPYVCYGSNPNADLLSDAEDYSDQRRICILTYLPAY